VICLKTENNQTANVAVLKVTHELLKEGNIRIENYNFFNINKPLFLLDLQ
jgi:hypothetical protein